MHDRVGYAGSMVDGRTVLETEPRGPAAAEMTTLWLFTKARLNERKKGPDNDEITRQALGVACRRERPSRASP